MLNFYIKLLSLQMMLAASNVSVWLIKNEQVPITFKAVLITEICCDLLLAS